MAILIDSTVYPKKYAHGFCFAVLCCGYTLTDFPISIRLTSLALWQSNDCPVPAKQPWWIWINTSCDFIMNDCITTTKQSTPKPCAYFLGYTVYCHLLSLLNITTVYSNILNGLRDMILPESKWNYKNINKISDTHCTRYMFLNNLSINDVDELYCFGMQHIQYFKSALTEQRYIRQRYLCDLELNLSFLCD